MFGDVGDDQNHQASGISFHFHFHFHNHVGTVVHVDGYTQLLLFGTIPMPTKIFLVSAGEKFKAGLLPAVCLRNMSAGVGT